MKLEIESQPKCRCCQYG